MEQEKIGRFIAQCRKEKGLTQAHIAEQFGISNRTVSKWETEKSLPDASIMIDLCHTLGITVNELLSGERMIGMEEYQNQVEENRVEMRSLLKSYRKRILISNLFLLLIAVVCAFPVPWVLIFIAFLLVFRNYYLTKNMNSVKKIIEDSRNA